jgi:hypothetical protein
MKTRTFSLVVLAGASLLSLWVAGCGSHTAATSSSLPAGVTPVDSNKPPPNMEALYQRSQAAKAPPPGNHSTGQ